MFAVFTRMAWMLVQPSALIVAAMLYGLWQLRRGRIVSASRWLGGAVAALLIAGLTPLGDLLVVPLEDRFPRPNLDGARIDGLIMIGGAEDDAVAVARDVIAVNGAAERYIEMAALARRFPAARVVFSGGGEPLGAGGRPQAANATRILAALGVPRERILLEDRSLTTWENALYTAGMLKIAPGERWLLITSAWHMPRAIGAFHKAGLPVEAYPVDYRTTGWHWLPGLRYSLADGLIQFDYVVREYPGLLIYWLTGRSSALFPAP